MSPEEEAQLRHLLRKGKQLPQPDKDLLGRVSKRWSTMKTSQTQRIYRGEGLEKRNVEALAKAEYKMAKNKKKEAK